MIHISIQGNHIHLLVEASNREALRNGIAGFEIRVARAINGERGCGKVFVERYHATQIKSARHARHALAYVLNNWRRHREDWANGRMCKAQLDEYSSAVSFTGWRGGRFTIPASYSPLRVSPPETWLLAKGWMQFGLIDPLEKPGPLF